MDVFRGKKMSYGANLSLNRFDHHGLLMIRWSTETNESVNYTKDNEKRLHLRFLKWRRD